MNRTVLESRPLLRRSQLLAEESLGSLLARLHTLNGYNAQYTFGSLVLPDLGSGRSYSKEHWDRIERPGKRKTYERLAVMTQLDPLELYRATEHSLSLVVTPPESELVTISLEGAYGLPQDVPLISGRVAFNHFFITSNAQYCPLCLSEDETPYHRLLWAAKCIASCTRHKVLLVSKCAECQSRIHVRYIVAGRCGKCDAELTKAPTISVATDEDDVGILSQELLRAWLLGTQPSINTDRYALPQQPSRVLYRLTEGLSRAVRCAEADWDFIHAFPGCDRLLTVSPNGAIAASPEQAYRVYATAVKAMLNWPTMFFEFLMTYRHREKACRALLTNLGGFYRTFLLTEWQTNDFNFVQDAFESFLAANQFNSVSLTKSPLFRSRLAGKGKLELMNVREAREELCLDVVSMRKLMMSNELSGASVMDSHGRRQRLLRRADFETLANQWRAGGWLSRPQAARLLGIHWRTIPSLMDAGLLPAIRGPKVDGFPIWIYSQDGVNACLNRLSGKIIPLSSSSATSLAGMISFKNTGIMLRQARRTSASASASAAASVPILQLVEHGKLQAYLYSSRSSKLPSLYFAEADVRAYLSM